MLQIDKFLTLYDLEGTAMNTIGDGVYLGKASSVKHLNYGYHVLWDIPENKGHISALDKVVLHAGEKIFGVLSVPKFRIDGATKLAVKIK